MIRNMLTALAIAALTLGATGCGGGDSTGPAPAPAAQQGTIVLLNESATDIISVNISSCADSEWGPNRLGASESLAPGALRDWTLEPGCYDLKASNGSKSASWFDLQVTHGGTVRLAVSSAVDPDNSVALLMAAMTRMKVR